MSIIGSELLYYFYVWSRGRGTTEGGDRGGDGNERMYEYPLL